MAAYVPALSLKEATSHDQGNGTFSMTHVSAQKLRHHNEQIVFGRCTYLREGDINFLQIRKGDWSKCIGVLGRLSFLELYIL